MRQDPVAADSETYKLKIAMFENSKPEEFLKLMKSLNTAINRIGNTTADRKINYVYTLLSG